MTQDARTEAGLLRRLEELATAPDSQALVDGLARAAAELAGFRVSLVTVATSAGYVVGGHNLSSERVERFRRRGREASLHEREINRRRIMKSSFPGTGIAYIPDAARAFNVVPTDREQRRPGSWHENDALYIMMRNGLGDMIGVCSLDAPLSGDVPEAEEIPALILAERLLTNAAPLIESRLFREELEESRESLRRSERLGAAGLVASGVAHDLGNVLVGIESYAATATPDPEAQAMLENIRAACERGRHLLQRLLGRTGSGSADVGRYARDAGVFLRGLVGPFIRLEIDTGDTPLPVSVDHGALDQILINLLLNARQAMPDGGTIKLECRPIDEHGMRFVSLAVRDAGCGMDAATAERAFEPFFTTKRDGHGLGLATVHRIVSNLRGRVRVESAPGEGTTVIVELPLVEVHAESQPE